MSDRDRKGEAALVCTLTCGWGGPTTREDIQNFTLKDREMKLLKLRITGKKQWDVGNDKFKWIETELTVVDGCVMRGHRASKFRIPKLVVSKGGPGFVSEMFGSLCAANRLKGWWCLLKAGIDNDLLPTFVNLRNRIANATVADSPTVSNFQESPPQTRNPAKNQNDLQKLMSVLEKKSSSIQIFLDSLVDVLEGYNSDEDYFFKTEVLKTMQIIKINRRNTQTTETSETALDIFNTII
ncbi:unnamed protein product [Gordionus sp. m RMFG-2023]